MGDVLFRHWHLYISEMVPDCVVHTVEYVKWLTDTLLLIIIIMIIIIDT